MATIELKDTIDVKYIDHMGSDERIVEAMLVSSQGLDAKEKAKDSISGRINFLMRRRHGTPFECGALTALVHAPIKVWREWQRHRVGWSYNEESARYKQLDPLFWMPPIHRPLMKADGWRPSAPEFRLATEEEHDRMAERFRYRYQLGYDTYQQLMEEGYDPGVARDVLGVGIFSACYVTCNPRSLMHFLELRTAVPEAARPSSPLWEIAEAARQMEGLMAELWPTVYEKWQEHRRAAP